MLEEREILSKKYKLLQKQDNFSSRWHFLFRHLIILLDKLEVSVN